MLEKRIGIVDYGVGNLASVTNALTSMNIVCEVLRNPRELSTYSHLILPGVGAFHVAMDNLTTGGWIEPLNQLVLIEKRPILGICLGMQLIADASEENGEHDGLGLIPGRVVQLQPTEPGFRVPNIGWSEVTATENTAVFTENCDGKDFYFVHSYHFCCKDPDNISGTIEYSGETNTAVIEKDSIFGFQFHPEKSQDAGIDLLDNYLTHLKTSGLV